MQSTYSNFNFDTIHVCILQPRVPLTEDERVQEQQKYGVYYQDEYDYLQHLRQPETAVLEPTLAETQKKVVGVRIWVTGLRYHRNLRNW